MKKIVRFMRVAPLFLAGLLCAGLCACNSGEDSSEAPVAKLTLDRTEIVLEEGESASIVAQVTDFEGDVQVVWTADSGAVTVSPDGMSVTVVAVSEGEATVTASATIAGESGEITLTAGCTVTVNRPALYVNVPAGKLVLRKNTTVTVKAFADESLTGEAVWTVSDSAIAKVESQGLIARVTALANGECEVKVSFGGRESSFTLVCGLN